jgi:hypothetical protein
VLQDARGEIGYRCYHRLGPIISFGTHNRPNQDYTGVREEVQPWPPIQSMRPRVINLKASRI